MVIFVFVGIELVGLVVGEIENFEKVLLEVINNIFIWIILFYLGFFFVIMVIYLWNSLNLDNSLFVEVFLEIGIMIVVFLINLVVLSVVVFVCNSVIYSIGCMFCFLV